MSSLLAGPNVSKQANVSGANQGCSGEQDPPVKLFRNKTLPKIGERERERVT